MKYAIIAVIVIIILYFLFVGKETESKQKNPIIDKGPLAPVISKIPSVIQTIKDLNSPTPITPVLPKKPMPVDEGGFVIGKEPVIAYFSKAQPSITTVSSPTPTSTYLAMPTKIAYATLDTIKQLYSPTLVKAPS